MKNENTSRQYLMDLAMSFISYIAMCNHTLENILAEKRLGVDGDEQKIIKQQILHDKSLSLRRKQMNYLVSKAKEYDDKMWCEIKHSSEGYGTMIEVYQADMNEETLEMLLESESIFVLTLSSALGFEFTDCGRCFSDKLKEGA